MQYNTYEFCLYHVLMMSAHQKQKQVMSTQHVEAYTDEDPVLSSTENITINMTTTLSPGDEPEEEVRFSDFIYSLLCFYKNRTTYI